MNRLLKIESCYECKHYSEMGICFLAEKQWLSRAKIPDWCPLPKAEAEPKPMTTTLKEDA